jgi:glucose-6-phosphate 1-dehydrogenase
MAVDKHLEPAVLVIFGAGDDLAWRKLVPQS